MNLDYNNLINNIKRRRFDEAIRDHVLSPSFADANIPDPVKYAMESMSEIDSAYAYKVYGVSRRIHELINRELLARNMRTDFRYQGALRVETHVRLYGEVDLLCILPENAPHQHVYTLGQLIREIATKQQTTFQSADYSDGVRIKLVTQKPDCRINVIPCSWISNPEYLERRNEIYRGIIEYNFKDKTRKKYLPFLNMGRVNNKDQETDGCYKMGVRLLRSLCVDESINLTNYELCGLIYHIQNAKITVPKNRRLGLLPVVSHHIQEALNDDTFQNIPSPSERELVFGSKAGKKEAVTKLQKSLDGLIGDLNESLNGDLNQEIQYIIER